MRSTEEKVSIQKKRATIRSFRVNSALADLWIRGPQGNASPSGQRKKIAVVSPVKWDRELSGRKGFLLLGVYELQNYHECGKFKIVS